jgi:hypothetical protein
MLLPAPLDGVRLCNAIESLARAPELRAQFGAAGIEFVRAQFGAEQIAAAFVENLRRAPFALPVRAPELRRVAPADSVMPHASLGN